MEDECERAIYPFDQKRRNLDLALLSSSSARLRILDPELYSTSPFCLNPKRRKQRPITQRSSRDPP